VTTQHRNAVAKVSANSVRFDSARYLEELMTELDRAAISVRMGESRDQAGFTQPEIAELLHVHMRTVQDWESPKKRTLPFDRMDEWARLTKVTREWLLYGTSEEPSESELLPRLEPLLAELNERLARIEKALNAPARPRKARPPASQR
jgi:DNA-binding transcriptional regulator YiaG